MNTKIASIIIYQTNSAGTFRNSLPGHNIGREIIDVNMTRTNKYDFINTCALTTVAVNFKFTVLPGIFNPDGSSSGEFDGTKENQGQFLSFMYEVNFV